MLLARRCMLQLKYMVGNSNYVMFHVNLSRYTIGRGVESAFLKYYIVNQIVWQASLPYMPNELFSLEVVLDSTGATLPGRVTNFHALDVSSPDFLLIFCQIWSISRFVRLF